MKLRFLFITFLLLISCNSNKDDFKLCYDKKFPYYHPTLHYQGGFYKIKKHFFDNFKEIDGANNTGIVRIQFEVNCFGETGNYDIETYSTDYKKIKITHKITQQILYLTKSLDNWLPAMNDEGEKIDSHKFLAFKFENGKLKDILPK